MKFERKKVILASLVFGWISIFWNVYDQLIQSINTYSFALDADKSGWVLAIDNILGLVVLPLFGHFSDTCKNKHGKRFPYIYIGTAISLVGLILVGFFAWQRKFWAYVGSLFVTLFAMAAYRSAALSLVPDFTYDPDRARANSIANLVSVAFTIVGIVLALVFMPLKASKAANFMPICLSVVGASLITMGVYTLTFSERQTVEDYNRRLNIYKEKYPEKYKEETVVVEELNNEQMKGNVINKILLLISIFCFFLAYNALVSNFTVYSDVILHFKMPQLPLIFMIVGALPGFIFADKVAKKIGRKYTVAIGLAVMFAALLLEIPFAKNTSIGLRIPLCICFIAAGVGYGFVMAHMYPFYLELSKAHNFGQNTGIFNGATTAAMVITPILAGYIIRKVGESSGATYTIDQVVNGVTQEVVKTGDFTILFPYCAAAVVLAFIAIMLVEPDYAKGKFKDRLKIFYHNHKDKNND